MGVPLAPPCVFDSLLMGVTCCAPLGAGFLADLVGKEVGLLNSLAVVML